MGPLIPKLFILVPALIVGIIFAMMVNPPADGDFTIKAAYRAISFLIGFFLVALPGSWLYKKFFT